MSSTLEQVRANVRVHIKDLDSRDYAIPTEALDLEIISKSQEMTDKALPGLSWSLAALSLSSGASDASFAVQDRLAVVSIRCVETGQIIEKLPRAIVESRREVPSSGSQPTGKPAAYYLIENSTNTLTVRFTPNADQAYTFDVLLSTMPSSGGAGVYGAIAASTVIPWGELMVRAIEKAVAITMLSKMTKEQAASRGINPGVIGEWRQDVASLVAAEQKRQRRRFLGGYLAPAVGP